MFTQKADDRLFLGEKTQSAAVNKFQDENTDYANRPCSQMQLEKSKTQEGSGKMELEKSLTKNDETEPKEYECKEIEQVNVSSLAYLTEKEVSFSFYASMFCEKWSGINKLRWGKFEFHLNEI